MNNRETEYVNYPDEEGIRSSSATNTLTHLWIIVMVE